MIALLLAAQLGGMTDGLTYTPNLSGPITSVEITPWCPRSPTGWCSQARDYGSDDVGKAMAICDKHERYTSAMSTLSTGPFDYESGWESCHDVREAWLKSEAARQMREAQEQEQRDLDFVKGVAEKQK